jgi:hypothetical protein
LTCSKHIEGPILTLACNKVCPICVKSLNKNKMPTLALAMAFRLERFQINYKVWHTYTEQLLIIRVCHNRCIIKVSSGIFKMHVYAISSSNPVSKIYNVLPPLIIKKNEVLAFIYINTCKPTKADFMWTPLLVRCLKMFKALHRLKLNHVDYYD